MLKLYICYAIVYKKKRGDYIKKLVNWSLLSDKNIIIENKNIECEFEKDKFIKYIEKDNTSNLVNLKDKIYIRENDEFIFEIDFENKEFKYLLKEKDIKLVDKILCEIQIKADSIKMTYQLDEEKKEIIIHLL